MQSPQPSQRLAWNCRVLKHLPTIKPLTPDLRHQSSPGQLWIGDEFGLDRRQIGAAQDELPHDAGIDEIVDRRDTNQMPVLEHDVPVDPVPRRRLRRPRIPPPVLPRPTEIACCPKKL